MSSRGPLTGPDLDGAPMSRVVNPKPPHLSAKLQDLFSLGFSEELGKSQVNKFTFRLALKGPKAFAHKPIIDLNIGSGHSLPLCPLR